jgi:hypothetical protein
MPSNRQMEDMSMSFGPYLSQMNAMTAAGQDFELYAPDSALSTPTFLTFAEASPSQSPHQGWISGRSNKLASVISSHQQRDPRPGCQVREHGPRADTDWQTIHSSRTE